MTWDGNGSFVRTKDWTNDRDASIKILASRHDENDDELRDGVAACLTKDGQSKPSADFKPNADASYSLGTTALRWVNQWLSGVIKFKQTNFAGTLQSATLTADRTHTLPDVTGVLVSNGVPADSSPNVNNDYLFSITAAASNAPRLVNMTTFANAISALAPFSALASTTAAGKVELATAAETSAGSSGTLAVTPLGLGANVNLVANGHLKVMGLIINWVSSSGGDSGTLNWNLGFSNLFAVTTGFSNGTVGSSCRITAAGTSSVSYDIDSGVIPSTVWFIAVGN